MIRAVTFDVGGTLIQPRPSVGEIYCEVAAQHGHRSLLAADVNRQFIIAWRGRAFFDYSRAAWAELVGQTFAGLIQGPLDEHLFSELYRRFERPGVWRIFDDVRPACERLKGEGIKLGVISNWDERLKPLLRLLALDHYFETVVVSCEVGYAKPSPIIFERAVQSLGVPPHSILHLGDSLEEDSRGAECAGLQGLLLDRDAPLAVQGRIRSLLDLEPMLLRAERTT